MAVVSGTPTANVPLAPWEDGLWLLQYLQRFLLRCWQPLRNTESAEDMLVRQWLILSPPSLFGPELVRSRVVWLSGTRSGAGRKSARERLSTQIPTSISSNFFFVVSFSFFVVTLVQAFGLEIYALLSTFSLSDRHRVTDLPPRTRVPTTSPNIAFHLQSLSPTHLSLIHTHTPLSLPRRSLAIYPPLRRNGRCRSPRNGS